MGFLKKVFRPVRKIAKKIIPKEVRPFLPYIAAGIPGAQGLASLNPFLNPAAQKALFAGLTSAATDEDGNPLRAAALAAAPDVLSSGLGTVAQKYGAAGDTADAITFTERVADIAGKTKQGIEGAGALKTIGAQTAIDQSAKFAEIRQDELDEYNRQLEEQGVLSKKKRRQGIYDIYIAAGYDPDYTNSVLDKYGYADGGLTRGMMSGRKGRSLRNLMTMDELLKRTPVRKTSKALIEDEEEEKKEPIIEIKEGEEIEVDDKGGTVIRSRDDLASGLMAAADGVQKAFGRSFGNMEPVPMLRFAKGGEVEIEEETDDLDVMDLMRDQGIEYGEQASAPDPFADYDDIARQLFGKPYKDLTPDEMDMMQEELERLMNKFRSLKNAEGIMQMASGYKTDIEEMYEQYVFEMEEMGLQPMSFSEFVARERAGMEEGGKVKRRKKDEPADEIIEEETQEEYFLDKMPQPKRQGIMEAADGGIMEKDMRGGGFIPEGSKERADDVPARLSKNEFVMTADAVRAAGGGSVNKGAKRMYDMMYSLEGKI